MSLKSNQQKSLKAAIPYVAAGGAIGAGLRYIMLELSPFSAEYSYLIIMAENVTGAFLLGLLAGLIARAKLNSWPWAPFLGAGILGSFTTFSTFMMDTIFLADESLLYAFAYVAPSVALGILAAVLGLLAAKNLAGNEITDHI